MIDQPINIIFVRGGKEMRCTSFISFKALVALV